MNYRKLGRYGLKVSEISLGGWLTQGASIDDPTTERIVHRAFDQGINLFDTADVYNRGEAERALAKAVKGIRREDLVLATKCFFPMSEGVNDRGLSRKHIVESVNASLKRLDTDYLDLMQFHRFDPETPLEESVGAIDDLVRQGKVLYWGVSEWKASEVSDLIATSQALGARLPISNQPRYNLLTRFIEPEIMPTCARHGMGLLVFSPLAQGILTGKYLPGQPPPAGSRGASDNRYDRFAEFLQDATLERVQKLKGFAESKGLTVGQLSLAWCLRRPEVSTLIIGATSIEQLDANLSAVGVQLSPEEWAEAEALVTPS